MPVIEHNYICVDFIKYVKCTHPDINRKSLLNTGLLSLDEVGGLELSAVSLHFQPVVKEGWNMMFNSKENENA